MNLEQLIAKIQSNTTFLKLKTVVENADGWHDHENVFNHCVKTANIAQRESEGNFIANTEAKRLFLAWMDKEIFGMQRKNILIVAALLHDCGKMLNYTEDEETKTLIMPNPKGLNQTICPGHEYWGGKLVVREILKKIDLSNEIKELIAQLVTIHGMFNNISYYLDKKTWTLSDILIDIKSKAEGLYKEAMFNAYCDCYDARAFFYAKKKIEELFSEPSLYHEREYFLPS